MLERPSFGLFLAVVILAPLPFGSTDPAVIAFWSILLGLTTIFAPRPTGRQQTTVLLLLSVFAAIWVSAIFCQLFLSDLQLARISDLVWKNASDALDEPLRANASVSRNQPFLALGAQIVSFLALLCGFLYGNDLKRARLVVWSVAVSGTIYALFGIVNEIVGSSQILWRTKDSYVNFLTATFVNRNTAATYFGACAIICLLLVDESIRNRISARAFRYIDLINATIVRPARRTVTPLLMLFITLCALFLTGSRAGVVFSLIALSVAVLCILGRRISSARSFIVGCLLLILSCGVIFELFGTAVESRFEMKGFTDSARLNVFRSTLAIIADQPVVGTGLGTFSAIFPSYRLPTMSTWGTVDRAHNTVLEIAAEMGVPAAFLVCVLWMAVFSILATGIRRRGENPRIPTTAFAVALLAALHSLVDFSLQIPGFSIVAFALIGTGLARSLGRADRRK